MLILNLNKKSPPGIAIPCLIRGGGGLPHGQVPVRRGGLAPGQVHVWGEGYILPPDMDLNTGYLLLIDMYQGGHPQDRTWSDRAWSKITWTGPGYPP